MGPAGGAGLDGVDGHIAKLLDSSGADKTSGTLKVTGGLTLTKSGDVTTLSGGGSGGSGSDNEAVHYIHKTDGVTEFLDNDMVTVDGKTYVALKDTDSLPSGVPVVPTGEPGPASVTASGPDGQVAVDWPGVIGAELYSVYSVVGSVETLLGTVTEPGYVDIRPTAKASDEYAVSATVSGVESAHTSTAGDGAAWRLIAITESAGGGSDLPQGVAGQYLGYVEDGVLAAVDAPTGGSGPSNGGSWPSAVGRVDIGGELTGAHGDVLYTSLYDANGTQHGGSFGNIQGTRVGAAYQKFIVTETQTFDRVRVLGMSDYPAYYVAVAMYDSVDGEPRNKIQTLVDNMLPGAAEATAQITLTLEPGEYHLATSTEYNGLAVFGRGATLASPSGSYGRVDLTLGFAIYHPNGGDRFPNPVVRGGSNSWLSLVEAPAIWLRRSA